MGLTLVLSDGEVITTDNAGPWQHTPEGFNTGLASNSVPMSQWDGAGGNYAGLYKTQPWVHTAVNFFARQVARLPLHVYEPGSEAGSRKRVTSGPLYDAITRPAKRCGPAQFKQWMTFPALLHGNSGIKKVRKSPVDPPSGFLPLTWASLEAKTFEEEYGVDYWIYSLFRRRQVLQPEDVVHLAWEPPTGLVGVSPLQALGVTLRIERAAQVWQEAMFRNSARPSGGVSLPEKVASDKDARRELREDLQRLHQGGPNAGRPVILPPGAKWEAFSHSANEVELIQQRKVTREEIAAVYNAPQPLIGIHDHSTFSNVAELHKMVYGPVLGPWLTLIEETFKAQVIDDEPAFEGQWIEFKLSEVLKGEPLKEATALKQQMSTGLLTINEGRAIQNMPPIDHPDCNRPMIQGKSNIAFVGGADPDDEPGEKALWSNVDRAGERIYRRMKAGEDPWDAGRFRRELEADLTTAKANNPQGTAEAWTTAMGAIVSDASGDAEVLRESLTALHPPTPEED